MSYKKIFIQIAAYRDPELLATINDCIEKAMYPHRLVFGICWQHDETESLGKYVKDKRFKIIDINYKQSKGCCWARAQVQKLYAGEEYTMQIDSHHRFIKNWDFQAEKMIQDLEKQGFRKPLLTTYPPAYEPNTQLNLQAEPQYVKFEDINEDGHITCIPSVIPNFKSYTSPIPGRFIAAGFIFTHGIFCKEVSYDPELYFNGEETNLSVRAFTSGYDIFHPHRTLLFHHYTRPSEPKHWKDLDWEKLQEKSSRRIFSLLHENNVESLGNYGLGSLRSLNDYEKFAGISFKKKQIVPSCLTEVIPSFNIIYDDNEWSKYLISSFNHTIKLKQELFRHTYDLVVVAYRDRNGKDIYRRDIYGDDLTHLFSNSFLGHYSINSKFFPTRPVYSWAVMPRISGDEWGRNFVGSLAKDPIL